MGRTRWLLLLMSLAHAPTTLAEAALQGTVWQVESIDASGIIDRSMITLAFSEDGRVSGNGAATVILAVSRARATRW